MNFLSLLSLNEFSLFDEQKCAIENVSNYLNKYSIEESYTKSALICMPTGTGKTGVMAYISRSFSNTALPGVLVLTPRTAVTRQIAFESFSAFFYKLENCPEIGNLPKAGYLISEEVKKNKLERSEKVDIKCCGKDIFEGVCSNKVFFMNIHLLNSLHNQFLNNADTMDANIYQYLLDNIGLIMFDEGHYEPAHKWADSIREFRRAAKVILTATPYRNDLRYFKIDHEFRYFLSYSEATEKGYIRNVEKVERAPRKLNHSEFANHVLKVFQKLKKENKIAKDAKAIIRCDNEESIKKIAETLDKKKVKFIAIHERFKSYTDGRYTSCVPTSIDDHEAWIWIHQFKLMEGIDAKKFQFLIGYDAHSNARSLIQEMGRGMRKSDNGSLSDNTVYYMDNEEGQSFETWMRFVKFDHYIRENNNFRFFDHEHLLNAHLEVLPEYCYFKGFIRERLKLDALKPGVDILLPKSCNVYSHSNLNISDVKSLIMEEFDDLRNIYLLDLNTEDTLCMIYVEMNPSGYFPNHLFLENIVEVIYVKVTRKYIYLHDKTNALGGLLIKNKLIEVVDDASLKRLISKNGKNVISQISLNNLNLSPNTIRQKNIKANNLINIASELDDFHQACSSISGYSNESNRFIRRYIGMNAGKITQDSNISYNLEGFNAWIEEINEILTGRRHASQIFNRYATTKKPTVKLEPSNIILYLDDFEIIFESEGDLINQLCVDINNGKFSISYNGKEYQFEIENVDNKRYRLNCVDFDEDYKSRNIVNSMTATGYLNQHQCFTILFNKANLAYSYGRYFEPEIKVGIDFDKNQFNIDQLLLPISELSRVESEKGKSGQKSKKGQTTVLPEELEVVGGKKIWPSTSVFRLIADWKLFENNAGFKKNQIKYLICTDMGTEMADFIVCNPNKVIFIHAKYGGGSKCSASNLQEVCAQAIKNINFLNPFNNVTFSETNKFNKPWKCNNQEITSRFIVNKKNTSNTDEIWSDFQKVIKKPEASTELWLVLGGLLSKKVLLDNLKSTKTNRAEAIQCCIQLLNLARVATSVGAVLKVFCNK